MKNTITLQQVKAWENLVDMDNTGEEIQALECYFLDNESESCWEDEAVEVAFNAYDYDYNHDFDSIKAALREVGVELDEDTMMEIALEIAE